MKLILAKLIICLIFLVDSGFTIADDGSGILIVHGQDESFTEVVNSLVSEIDSEIVTSDFVVIPMTKVENFNKKFEETKPNLIVLVGNHAINLYYDFQQKYSGRQFPPAFMVAALNIDYHATRIKNSVGIRYEVPAATMLVNWRGISSNKIERVGVIHREGMTDLVQRNQEYCKSANIELVSYSVPNEDSNMKRIIKNRLSRLKSQGVDALWIVNDSGLLSADLLRNVWLPFVQSESLPVVVGIEALASRKINLGTFSVIPDLSALGEQAATLIFEIEENDWDIAGMKIDAPISVKKTLNLQLATQLGIELNNNNLDTIDVIIR